MQTCIMAGCDFVKALPGIGVKKAHLHMRRLRSFVRVRHHHHPTANTPLGDHTTCMYCIATRGPYLPAKGALTPYSANAPDA